MWASVPMSSFPSMITDDVTSTLADVLPWRPGAIAPIMFLAGKAMTLPFHPTASHWPLVVCVKLILHRRKLPACSSGPNAVVLRVL